MNTGILGNGDTYTIYILCLIMYVPSVVLIRSVVLKQFQNCIIEKGGGYTDKWGAIPNSEYPCDG